MRLNGKWGLLDSNGNVVVDFKYSNPVQEWGENFIIRLNRKCAGEEKSTYFIMDKNKNIHAELNFDSIYPHANFAIVEKDNRYGIIDKDLKFTVAVVFDYLMPARYENEYLCGSKSGRWGILDYKGNIIFGFMYEEVSVEKIDGKYIFKLMSGGKWSLFNFCKV